ncbi:MAG: ATP-binding protein [Bacteroidales bacterium]|nr:ATP-binding protein [Bacteroidales bacterium]
MPTFNKSTKKAGASPTPGSSPRRNQRAGRGGFEEREPRWGLDGIVLQETVKAEVQAAIDFCKHQQELIERFELDERFLKGRASVGINLYGPPGTGKSITAEAIAKALDKKLIVANYADLLDSQWGGTEKQLSAVFEQAQASGSIIFMDEADGIMGRRTSQGANSETNNQIKSHLLTLTDSSNVIVIYATNLFENIDRAFFRRILFHIKVPMPTKEELAELWRLHIGSENLPKKRGEFSYEELAAMSEGQLAGGDIKNIALKLCVKIGCGHVDAISTQLVRQEIDKYKQSLADSRGEKGLQTT